MRGYEGQFESLTCGSAASGFDMKRFGLFHPVVLSFFSSALYRDVARHWKGVCFGYLFLLLAVLWIPVMVDFHLALGRFARDDAPPMIEQVPRIEIEDGVVSVDAEQPYRISDPETGEVIVVLDTTGQVTSLDDFEGGVLLTESQLIYKKNHFETRSFDLSQVESVVIDADTLQGWVDAGSQWCALVFYPLCLIVSCVYRMLQALLYGAVGLLFNAMTGSDLAYPSCVRLAVMAVTPVLILDTALGLLDLSIPFWWPLCLVIAMGYLFFGVKSAAEPGDPDAELGAPPDPFEMERP